MTDQPLEAVCSNRISIITTIIAFALGVWVGLRLDSLKAGIKFWKRKPR